MSANIKDINTRDEVRLLLLEHAQTGIQETLKEIKTDIKSISNKIDSVETKLQSKIDSHFHWVMGSVSVLYISLIGTLVTALAKSLRWF